MTREVWEVVLARRYFEGGANKRCDRWDVGMRQSKTKVLGLSLIAGMGHRQVGTWRVHEDYYTLSSNNDDLWSGRPSLQAAHSRQHPEA